MNNRILKVMAILSLILGLLSIFFVGYEQGFIIYIPLFLFSAIIFAFQIKKDIDKKNGEISPSQKLQIYRLIVIIFLGALGIGYFIINKIITN